MHDTGAEQAKVIAERLQSFRRQTAPLLDYYRSRGVLDVIDGLGTPDDVFGRVRIAVDKRQASTNGPTTNSAARAANS